MDYTNIRLMAQCVLSSQNIDNKAIDRAYTLYYDETNNIKKFYIKEDGTTNVPKDTIFVLGGLEGNKKVSFEDVKRAFNLQDNVKEIKSKHIYHGTFCRCLRSKKLNILLDLIKTNGWHIHFQSLNLLYWSLVDIIDSISDSIVNICVVDSLKAFLYKIAKEKGNDFISILYKYNYPNIKNQETIQNFYLELMALAESLNFNDNTMLGDFKNLFLEFLEKGSRQEEAIFIQDEKPLQLLGALTEFYRCEIYTWKNCELIFDEEQDIMESIRNSKITLYGESINNYKFVNSKDNVMVQLSDLTIGIISRYLQFIDEEGLNLPNIVSSFNETQMKNFIELNAILWASREYNPVFFHQVTSLEYHGLLNKYIDMYNVE